MKYKFENLDIQFDGSEQQAAKLKERVEALGYRVVFNFKKGDKYLAIYKDSNICAFQPFKNQVLKLEKFDNFMNHTEQHLPAPAPKPTPPCAAHDFEEEFISKDEQELWERLSDAYDSPLTQGQVDEIVDAVYDYFIKTGRMQPLSAEQ